MDAFTTVFCSMVVLERYAATQMASTFADDFEAADINANKAGLQTVEMPMVWAWPRLSHSRVARCMGVWGFSWTNAATKLLELPGNQQAWRRNEGEKSFSCLDREAVLLYFHLLVSERLQRTVQKAAAIELLPEPG